MQRQFDWGLLQSSRKKPWSLHPWMRHQIHIQWRHEKWLWTRTGPSTTRRPLPRCFRRWPRLWQGVQHIAIPPMQMLGLPLRREISHVTFRSGSDQQVSQIGRNRASYSRRSGNIDSCPLPGGREPGVADAFMMMSSAVDDENRSLWIHLPYSVPRSILFGFGVYLHWALVVGGPVSIHSVLELIVSAGFFNVSALPQANPTFPDMSWLSGESFRLWEPWSLRSSFDPSLVSDDTFDFLWNLGLVFGGFLWLAMIQLLVFLCAIVSFFVIKWATYRVPARYKQEVGQRRLSVRKVCHRTRKGCGFFLFALLMAQEGVTVATSLPPTSDENITQVLFEQTWPVDREVQLYWSRGTLPSFMIAHQVPFWTYREVFGRVVGLEPDGQEWNLFMLHKVMPSPHTANPLALHYLLGLPGDRSEHESLVLVDVFYHGMTQRLHRTVFPLESHTTSASVIEQLGFAQLCDGNHGRQCKLWFGPHLWSLYSVEYRFVFDGTYLKLFIPQVSCEVSSDSPGFSGTQADVDEDATFFMQTRPEPFWLGFDEIRGLLLGRVHYLGIPEDAGFPVYVWGFAGMVSEIVKREKRAWLDPQLTSWTERILAEYYVAGRAYDFEFHLVQPLPPHIFLARFRVHILVKPKDPEATHIAVLADVWYHASQLRRAIHFETGSTVRSILRLIYWEAEIHDSAHLIWETHDGDIVFNLDDAVIVPQGSYIKIFASQECEADTSTFVTISYLAKRGYQSSTDGAQANDLRHETATSSSCGFEMTPFRGFIFNQEEAFLDAILQLIGDWDEKCQLLTYGLGYDHIDTRKIPIGKIEIVDLHHIAQKISSLWQDVIMRTTPPFRLFFVNPQPENEANTLHLLIDFWPSGPGIPILFHLDHFDHNTGTQLFEYVSCRSAPLLSLDLATRYLRLPYGWRDLGYRCLLAHRNQPFDETHEFQVVSGCLYKLIAVLEYQEDLAAETIEDRVELMQRGFDMSPKWSGILQYVGTRPRHNHLHIMVWRICFRVGIWRSSNWRRILASKSQDWRIDWEQHFPNLVEGGEYRFLKVEPKPVSLSNVLGAEDYFLLFSDLLGYAAFLVDISTPRQWSRSATYLHLSRGMLDTRAIFTLLVPDNNCATTSWCRVSFGANSVDWPQNFDPDINNYLQLIEIEPDPWERASDASADTTICSSASEGDESLDLDYISSFVQLRVFHFATPVVKPSTESEIFGSLRPIVSLDDLQFCCRIGEITSQCHGLRGPCTELLRDQVRVRASDFPIWDIADSFRRLRPPGNPNDTGDFAIFVSSKFDCLDDVAVLGKGFVVYDWELPRQEISIAAALDCQPVQGQTTEVVTFLLPELSETLSHLFDAFSCMWPDISEVEELLPLDTMTYFSGLETAKHLDVEELLIYTDGSFFPENSKAGWSFVVLGVKEGSLFKVHAACGPLKCQDSTFGGTGATKTGSREGETEALIMALIWRIGTTATIPAHFLFDSVTTGFPTAGIWNFQPFSRHLRVARSLAQFAEVLMPKCNHYSHVKAHNGCHGNELADLLAKCGADMQSPMGISPIDFGRAVQQDPLPIEWLWIGLKAHESDTLPQAGDRDLKYDNVFTTPTVQTSLPESLICPAISKVKGTKTLACGFVTYNVQTLDAEAKPHRLYAQTFLREQLQSHCINFAFIQESRSRASGLFVSNTHLRCVAQADQGHGGTEVWLLRYRKGQLTPLVQKEQVLVCFAQHELLVLKAHYCGLNFVVASGHAPHSSRPNDHIMSWWAMLEEQLRHAMSPGFILVLGLDANAHFSSPFLPHLGEHGLEQSTNENARCMMRILQAFDLFVPSSFAWLHEGETATWRRFAHSSPSRCDYLCFPLTWKDALMTSKILESLDIAGTHKDHSPLATWIRLNFEQRHHRPKLCFDRDKLKQAGAVEFASLDDALPAIPWHVNVHEHAQRLTAAVSDWICKSFPVTVRKPRRSYISETTWELRAKRLHAVSQIRVSLELCAGYYSFVAFLAWKACVTLSEIHDECWPVLYLLRKKHRVLECQLHDLKIELRKALRRDRTAFLEEIATAAEQASQQDFFRILRQAGVAGARRLQGPRPLPLLFDDQGQSIITSDGQKKRWREFFAEQEDGIAVTADELFNNLPAPSNACLQWTDFPSLIDYEFALRKVKCGKAFFADGIPGEFLHQGASFFAQHGYSLFLKHYLTANEPVLFRGGRLTNMYKGKGNPAICENHRSLFISSTLGKVHHSLVRAKINPSFDRYVLPLQWGGRKGKSVTMASQSLQALLTASKHQGYSTAVIFVDIRNAFYKVIRNQLDAFGNDADSLHRLFATLGLPAEAFAEFLEFQQQEHALDEADLDPHLRRILDDAILEDLPGFTQTRRGSRPGDVFADQLFSFTFSKILKQVASQLEHLGLQQFIRWSGRCSPHADSSKCELRFLGPVWADDLAVVVRHQNPAHLLKMTQATAGFLFDSISSAGLCPNMKPGKTEVMINLRGSGSVQLRRRFVQEGQFLPTTSRWIHEPLRVVASYKHLGVWLLANGSIRKELKVRFGSAHQLMTQLKPSTFANKGLSLRTKVRLFDCLIVSSLLYNAATWQPFDLRLAKYYHVGFVKLFRRLAILHFGIDAREWNERCLLHELQVLAPELYLSAARLRHLLHLIQNADIDVWAMLQQVPAWWNLVEADLQWLQSQRRYPLPFGTLFEDWDSWQSFIVASPMRWKQIIRRALKHATLQCEINVTWDAWHADVVRTFEEVCPVPEMPAAPPASSKHYCIQCQQLFASKSAWATHSFRKHGRMTSARQVAGDTQCGSCLKTYADHPSLIRHLTYSKKCQSFLSRTGAFTASQPSVNSRTQQPDFEFRTPFMRGEGPLQPSPLVFDPFADLHEWQKSLSEQLDILYDSVTDALTVEQLFQQIILILKTSLLHQDEIVHVFALWSSERLRSGVPFDRLWRETLDLLVSRLCAALFLDGAEGLASNRPSRDVHEVLETWLAKGTTVPSVPRLLRYSPLAMAHLFSGHRRSGDIQSVLESALLPAGFEGLVLSIDIIFSERWGNLLRADTYDYFVKSIKAGHLVVIFAGPPCETWSRARLHGAEDGGPQIVRHAASLKGLTALTLREGRQVLVGNQLLGVAVKLAFMQLVEGAFLCWNILHVRLKSARHLYGSFQLYVFFYSSHKSCFIRSMLGTLVLPVRSQLRFLQWTGRLMRCTSWGRLKFGLRFLRSAQ